MYNPPNQYMATACYHAIRIHVHLQEINFFEMWQQVESMSFWP